MPEGVYAWFGGLRLDGSVAFDVGLLALVVVVAGGGCLVC